MDAASGWCRGCLRTLDEIACWSVLGDDDKRAVLAELGPRATERRRRRLAGTHPAAPGDEPLPSLP